MEQRLEKLLEEGRTNLKEKGDRKTYVSLTDIKYLIQQGARIETNNRFQEGNVYLQEVIWQEFWYITTTTKRVALP